MTQQSDSPQSPQSSPSSPPPGVAGEEYGDIQEHLASQPEQVPGTPGLSLEDRIKRIETHLGLDRIFVHDADQPGGP